MAVRCPRRGGERRSLDMCVCKRRGQCCFKRYYYASAAVITAGPDLECCQGRVRRGEQGPRTEANGGEKTTSGSCPRRPKEKPSAFRGKTRATSRRSRNLIPSFEYAFWKRGREKHPLPPLPPLSSWTVLNPDQISGPWGEEIVVHFLTNRVKRTLRRALRKQMAVFITGGH